MNSDYKIGKVEAIFFILIVMVNKIILNLPKAIIKTTGTGSIVNIIFTGTIAILIILLISYLFKKFPNEDILDVSEYIGGKFLKIIIGLAYISFFTIVITTVIIRFSELLKIVYFKNSPALYIIIFFLVGICFANKAGFKSIVKTNFIILPFILASMILVLFGISKYISTDGLFPILGNNVKNTFLEGSLNLFAYGGITYLYFIMPTLKNKKDFRFIGLTFITISILFLLITVAALLMVFPFITHTEELLSVYVLVRIVEFGEFLQRTDALFIFLWIISTLSYLSISLMFTINIFKKLTHIQDSKEMSYSFCAIILGIIILLKNPNWLSFLEDVMYKYFLLILVFGISLIIMIIGNFKKFFRKRRSTC